jgi:hypothetical protein
MLKMNVVDKSLFNVSERPSLSSGEFAVDEFCCG